MTSAPKDEERHRNLGVLHTAYLDKRNPINGYYKKRFVVLTHEAIHWFQRNEGYDLFGEERGNVSLGSILSTRILDEDSNIFEIQGTDTKKRLFRASTPLICEEWVMAIRSAVKAFTDKQRANKKEKNSLLPRKQSLANIKFSLEEQNEKDDNNVGIQLVSVWSSGQKVEYIVTRSPVFDHIISIPQVYPNDKLNLSLSNGGFVSMEYNDLEYRSDGLIEFEVPVQSVALASSLKLLLERELTSTSNPSTGGGGGGGQTGRYVDLLSSALDDRSQAVSLVLAMAVVVVIGSSFKSVDADTFLLYLFAFILSVYQLYQAVQKKHAIPSETATPDSKSMSGGLSVRLTILGHSLTPHDAAVNEDPDEIPERFIRGCEGDMKEARRRWDITRHWREQEGVNNILYEKQPHFNIIKSMYPHYHAGKGKDGHVVFYEREGQIEVEQLAARDVKVKEMLKHWIFVTEYHWEVVCKGDPLGKSISVMDLEGLALADLAGSNLEYVKTAMTYANQHYPERSHIVFIVNAPWYFSVGWKMVKGYVHPNTQKKIRILSKGETLAGLMEDIDISQIPVYYGGQLDFNNGADKDSCRWHDPTNLQLQEYVDKLNRGEVVAPSIGTTAGTSITGGYKGDREGQIGERGERGESQRLSTGSTASSNAASASSSTSTHASTSTCRTDKDVASQSSGSDYKHASLQADDAMSVTSSSYSFNSSDASVINGSRNGGKGVSRDRSVHFASHTEHASPVPSVSSLGASVRS